MSRGHGRKDVSECLSKSWPRLQKSGTTSSKSAIGTTIADHMRYIGGGKDFTSAFQPGDTVGIGMNFSVPTNAAEGRTASKQSPSLGHLAPFGHFIRFSRLLLTYLQSQTALRSERMPRYSSRGMVERKEGGWWRRSSTKRIRAKALRACEENWTCMLRLGCLGGWSSKPALHQISGFIS
jgi:hypothetical protein